MLVFIDLKSDPSNTENIRVSGNSLLVKPVTAAGQDEVMVYFPGGDKQVNYSEYISHHTVKNLVSKIGRKLP